MRPHPLSLTLAVLAACRGDPAHQPQGGSASLPVVIIDSGAPALDTEDLARRLVARSARLREGDLVFLRGSSRDLALLEDLAIEARKVGADPLISVQSDRLRRREYDEVPSKYDGRTSEMRRRLADFLTAEILVDSKSTDTGLRGVPPSRIAARLSAMRPVLALADRRSIRRVSLGNGLFPTEERARRFGMTQAALAKVFWRGVNVDYEALQASGADIRRRLVQGKEVRLTHPNGTSLTMRVAGRPVLVSDGVISAEDERRGGPATSVWLPAGEVFLTPVPGTANGVVVADRYAWEGRTIDKLRLEFDQGKLTSMSAGSDMSALQAFYDAAPAGKDELGALDIGINPAITIPQGSTLLGWMAAGMVTIVVGANGWAGGTNHAVSGVAPFLPGTTLLVDGVPLVKDGRLHAPEPVVGGGLQ
jgi:aminopeptidase